jgi:hypothetical protein
VVEHALELVARLLQIRAVLNCRIAIFAAGDDYFDAETVQGVAERVANIISVHDYQYARFFVPYMVWLFLEVSAWPRFHTARISTLCGRSVFSLKRLTAFCGR